ncbi:L-glutamate gamma-semialdehyde dehydrogenase [Bacillus thuringiensis]
MMTNFKNEPLTNFKSENNIKVFEKELDNVKKQFGNHYKAIIAGALVDTNEQLVSINPSNKNEIIGTVTKANTDTAELAMQTACKYFENWKNTTFKERSRILFKAAALMRKRKHEFSAWLVYESGKTWDEADGDTAEAIDFLEYYGRQAIELENRSRLTHLPGENNELYYLPLGVGVIITPWNFPLAILTGMTSAALVTGNTTIVKPSENTSIIAYKFVELMIEAGIPNGVINFIPGIGSEVGEYLVKHSLTRFISFTGSRNVGLRINQLAAIPNPNQKWMKRVITEMGGKDAIIIDQDTDLDFATDIVINSTFGFAGQKCASCSRVIIDQKIYDQTIEILEKKIRNLKVGESDKLINDMGPVIDEAAYQKILKYIEIGKQEAILRCGGEITISEKDGYYIQPTLFVDVPVDSRIAQEEIFGPVLSVFKADNFVHALEIANNTDYGLTSSVISNNRKNLELARKELHVGNLYFNRKCTGALVGVHPFGGFNMSGTDSKAGGPDYLLLFTQPKLVSELF